MNIDLQLDRDAVADFLAESSRGSQSTSIPSANGALTNGITASPYIAAMTTAAPSAQLYSSSAYGTPKDGVLIVLIDEHGQGHELVETKSFTPREMLGLNKLYMTVQMFFLMCNGNVPLMRINWMTFIKTEGIERLFVSGESEDWYKNNADTYSSVVLLLHSNA